MPDAFIRPRQRASTAVLPHQGNPNVLIPKRPLIEVISVSGGWRIDSATGFSFDLADNDGTVFPEVVFKGILPGLSYRVQFDITVFTGVGVPAADVLLEGYLGDDIAVMFKLDNLSFPAPHAEDTTDTSGTDNKNFRLRAADNTTVSLITVENFSLRRL